MLHFRRGKIFSFFPKFEISIGRPIYYKGLEMHVIFWSRGYLLAITTKKIYQEYKLDMERRSKEHMERRAREQTGQTT
jgi:hypothetical protein